MTRTKKICKLLRTKSGKTITQIAKENKVSRQLLYSSIKGGGSRRIRIKIACIIQLSPSIIWHDMPPHKRLVDDFKFLESL